MSDRLFCLGESEDGEHAEKQEHNFLFHKAYNKMELKCDTISKNRCKYFLV